ncbi:MAG: Ig-like domain-containing protein [Planctomycetaceae bacterium]
MLLANWLKLFARRLFSNRAIRKLPPPRKLRSRRRRAAALAVRTERLEERVLLSGVAAEIDTYDLSTDGSLEGATSVLVNDAGEGLSAFQLTGPEYGELSFNTDGTFYYTPNPGWTGVDRFEYAATDGADTASATVYLNVVAGSVEETTMPDDPAGAGPGADPTAGSANGEGSSDGPGSSEGEGAADGSASDEAAADESDLGDGSETSSSESDGTEPDGSESAVSESSYPAPTEPATSGESPLDPGDESDPETPTDNSADDESSSDPPGDASGDSGSAEDTDPSSADGDIDTPFPAATTEVDTSADTDDSAGSSASSDDGTGSSSGSTSGPISASLTDTTGLGSEYTTLIGRLVTAISEYYSEVSRANAEQATADSHAIDEFNSAIISADEAWFREQQRIAAEFQSAASVADADLAMADLGAQLDYAIDVQALNDEVAAARESSETDLTNAIIAAESTFSGDAAQASQHLNAAVAAADAEELAGLQASHQTYQQTISALLTTAEADDLAATQAYFDATGYWMTSSIDYWQIAYSDSQYRSEYDQANATAAGEIARINGEHQTTVNTAYDTYNGAILSAQATLQGILHSNAASYLSRIDEIADEYETEVNSISDEYSRRMLAAQLTYIAAIASSQQTYASSARSAYASYKSAVEAAAEGYVEGLLQARSTHSEKLAENQTQYDQAREQALQGVVASLRQAKDAYDTVANDPDSTAEDRAEAVAARIRATAHAIADFLNALARASQTKADADATAEATYSNKVSADAVRAFQAQALASSNLAKDLIAAGATLANSQLGAAVAFSNECTSSGTAANTAAANAYHTAITDLISAEQTRYQADRQATHANAAEVYAAESTLYSSLVSAYFSQRSDLRTAGATFHTDITSAMLDALGRFNEAEGTPYSQYVLAVGRIGTQYSQGERTAWFTRVATEDGLAQAWISSVSSAEESYFSAMSSSALTYDTETDTALATYAKRQADATLQFETGSSTLWGTYDTKMTANAEAWWKAIITASKTAAETSVTTDYLYNRTVSNEVRGLQQDLTRNWLTAFKAGTAAGTELTSDVLSALTDFVDAATATDSSDAGSTELTELYSGPLPEFEFTGLDGPASEFPGEQAIWHHLFPQQLRDRFEELNIDIDSAEWGRLMTAADHTELHNNGWNKEWDEFFKDFDVNKGRAPTRDEVLKKLNDMGLDDDFNKLLNNGTPAAVSYKKWGGLGVDGRTSYFNKARKAFAVLVGLFTAIAASDEAFARMGPALDLGDESLQSEYSRAVQALMDERFHDAEQLIFGRPNRNLFTDSTGQFGILQRLFARIYTENPRLEPNISAFLESMRRRFWEEVR